MSTKFQCNNCKNYFPISKKYGNYCSRSCCSIANKKPTYKCEICKSNVILFYKKFHDNKIKTCQYCNKKYCMKYNDCAGLYCSHSCSAKATNSKSKIKHGRYSSEYKKLHPPKYFHIKFPHSRIYGYKNCNCCNKGFWALTNEQVNCSKDCARKSSTYMKHTIKYEHDNEIILLDSTWELKIAEYLDENNIKWIRPKHLEWYDSKNKLRRFYPDFYLPEYNIYIDPKNDYRILQDNEKLEYFKNKIELYYGKVHYLKNIILALRERIEHPFFNSKSNVLNH